MVGVPETLRSLWEELLSPASGPVRDMIVDILSTSTDPGFTNVPPVQYGFPPCVVPFANQAESPRVIGALVTPFHRRATTWVQVDLEHSSVREVARTPEQLLPTLLRWRFGEDAEAVDFCRSRSFNPNRFFLPPSFDAQSDPLYSLDVFRKNTPRFIANDASYSGSFPSRGSTASDPTSLYVFEIDWLSLKLPEDGELPSWLQKPGPAAFQESEETHDPHIAWMSCGSRGWTYGELRSRIESSALWEANDFAARVLSNWVSSCNEGPYVCWSDRTLW